MSIMNPTCYASVVIHEQIRRARMPDNGTRMMAMLDATGIHVSCYLVIFFGPQA